MRLLVVHEIFPPEFSGGGERILLEIIKRLKRYHKITVITSGNPKLKEFNKIKTVRISTHRILFNLLGIPMLLTYGKRYHILIGNTYHAAIPTALTSFLLKKPSVCIVHGAYGKKWLKICGLISPMAIFLEKIIFKLPFSYFLFFSDFARESARRLGVDSKRVIVIPPGIDLSKFKKRKKKSFVLFVGRLERQKGIDTVIETAKRLPHIKFILVGKKTKYVKLKILPSNVEWKGFVSDKTLIKLYEEALIFFLPSVAETLGYSILEAMAAGCAVVSTVQLPYLGHRIKEGESIEEIAKIIDRMVREKSKTVEIGLQNRNIVGEHYRWKNFINRFNTLLYSLGKEFENSKRT